MNLKLHAKYQNQSHYEKRDFNISETAKKRREILFGIRFRINAFTYSEYKNNAILEGIIDIYSL